MGEGGERVVDDLPMWRCYALPPTPLSQPRLCTSRGHGPLMQSKTRCDSNGRKAIMWVSAIKSFTNDDLEELKVCIELGFVKLLLNMGQITS